MRVHKIVPFQLVYVVVTLQHKLIIKGECLNSILLVYCLHILSSSEHVLWFQDQMKHSSEYSPAKKTIKWQLFYHRRRME